MKRQDSVFTTGLAVLSGLTSFIFIYYAVGVLTAESAEEWTRVFAYVAAGYGLGNIYILSWAWRSSGTGPAWANKLIALCFLGVFLMDIWRRGVDGGMQYVGACGVALVLWLNWFAVRKITSRGTDRVDRTKARRSRK